MNTDPGADPGQQASTSQDAQEGGFIPGGGRGGGQSSQHMDALQGGRGGPGSGSLAGGGQDGPRVGGDSTIPASLRAYVRRYLETIRGGQTDGN